VLISVLLVAVRHFFNLWHTGYRAWWILGAAAAGTVALAFWLEPEEAPPSTAEPVSFAQIQPIVEERCAACHAGAAAPLGVRLETQTEIEARAGDIERQAVLTRTMPPGNSTGMTEEERELLAAWIASTR
jgi:uncharacterized membrane protein